VQPIAPVRRPGPAAACSPTDVGERPATCNGREADDTVELFHRVNAQDFTASEGCQPNMRSRAYRDGGVLVPAEQEIIGRWYYRWYRAATDLPEQP
jgi:glycine betaine catabolism A